jgi:hypothetical protein
MSEGCSRGRAWSEKWNIHKLTIQLMKMLVILLQDFSAMKMFLSFYMMHFWKDLNPHITTYIVVHGHAYTNKTLILGYTVVCKTMSTVSHDCSSRTS